MKNCCYKWFLTFCWIQWIAEPPANLQWSSHLDHWPGCCFSSMRWWAQGGLWVGYTPWQLAHQLPPPHHWASDGSHLSELEKRAKMQGDGKNKWKPLCWWYHLLSSFGYMKFCWHPADILPTDDPFLYMTMHTSHINSLLTFGPKKKQHEWCEPNITNISYCVNGITQSAKGHWLYKTEFNMMCMCPWGSSVT